MFHNKVAVITGAAHGIGKVIAQEFEVTVQMFVLLIKQRMIILSETCPKRTP